MADPQYKPVRYSDACSVCTHNLVQIVDGMKDQNYTIPKIFEFAKKNGLEVSSQMLQYHWKHHTSIIRPRHTRAIINREMMELIDKQLATPEKTAAYALNVVDKGIKDGEIKPRTWRDAMETIRVAKDVQKDSDSTVYLQQLVQINNYKEEDVRPIGDNTEG